MAGIRCFIAIDVMEGRLRERIRTIQQDLLSTKASLKLVQPENLHFTLHFLGNVDNARLPQLQSIIQTIEATPFEATLNGLQCYRPSRPRVVWIGVTKGAENFIQLQTQLGTQLRKHGFSVERRKYSPHLTVARVRSGVNRGPLLRVLTQLANYEFGQLQVNAVKLKKSTLTPKGPIYEDIEVKTLSPISTD